MKIFQPFKFLKSRVHRFDNTDLYFVTCFVKGNGLTKKICTLLVVCNSIVLTVSGYPSPWLDVKGNFTQLDSFINQNNAADCSTAFAVCNIDLVEIQSIRSFGLCCIDPLHPITRF
jgi:hypothetical protein